MVALAVALAGCEELAPDGNCFYVGDDYGACTPRPRTRVTIENALAGATDWWIPYPQWASKHEIEGYTDKLSYDHGETVNVALSSRVPGTARWRMYRLGWYDGNGARLIDEGTVATVPRVLPPVSTWDTPCDPRWPATLPISLAPDLVSGVYAVRLDEAAQAMIMTFTVREDDRMADIVYQRSDFTDVMYNNWDGTTNRSSYYGDHPQYVAINRVQRSPAGYIFPYSAGFFSYEVSLVRFLEREGYDVTYLSNVDVHENAHALDRGRVFLSAGHDEYWTREMRDAVENARDSGKHLAIFGSDTCDGILRFDPDNSARISVAQSGATASNQIRETWGELAPAATGLPHDNPEDTLIGTHYAGWCGDVDKGCLGSDGFAKLRDTYEPSIETPAHPVFRRLPDGVNVGQLMGYEFEVHDSRIAGPKNLQVVADVPSIVQFGLLPVVVAYETDEGAKVFNVGSMHFLHGLDRWAGGAVFREEGSPRPCAAEELDCFDVETSAAQQMTVNVLADMGAIRHSPRGDLTETQPCDWNAPAAHCVGSAGRPRERH